jgi:uncharacterized protein YjeT (DUF2065 family)
MADFIVALGLVFVIEGLIFAASPGAAKNAMAHVMETADGPLRVAGLVNLPLLAAVVALVLLSGVWNGPVLLTLVHAAAWADLNSGGSAKDSLTYTLNQLLAHGPAVLDVANPDQPLARLQIATLIPINIQREKRSASHPKIGAVNM